MQRGRSQGRPFALVGSSGAHIYLASARELPNLSLQDALQPVHLYAERGSPKYEKAAMRWLERYLTEGSPRLRHFAEVTMSLAKRECGLN